MSYGLYANKRKPYKRQLGLLNKTKHHNHLSCSGILETDRAGFDASQFQKKRALVNLCEFRCSQRSPFGFHGKTLVFNENYLSINTKHHSHGITV